MSDTYPQTPGWRDPDTSRESAEKMASYSVVLREQVYAWLKHTPAAVHQVAASLDVTVPAIQPRFSELVAEGRIEKTGRRHVNASGHSAAVWKTT